MMNTIKQGDVMSRYMCLCDLPLNSTAIIYKIDDKLQISDRLADMGLIKGCVITAKYKSPFGDPIAYRINNSVIAIRKSDCLLIIVKECPDA